MENNMSYLDKHLAAGEKLVYEAKVSRWTFFWYYVLGIVTIFIYGLGLLFFLAAWLKRNSTELGITDKRVIAKFGIVRRDTTELPLSRVESIRVHQTVFGRLLNYGTIVIAGSGNPSVVIPRISDPMSFRSAVLNTQ